MTIALLSASFVLCSCYALGRILSRSIDLPWAVHLILGMAGFNTALFCLLACDVYTSAVLAAVGTIVLVVFAVAVRPRLLLGAKAVIFNVWRTESRSESLIVCVYFVYYGVQALAPEILYDSSGYHLGLPAEWLRLGGFPARVGFYELLPQGLEELYGFALALSHDSVAPKLVHLACLAATIALIHALARRCGLQSWVAAITSVIYIASPIVGLTATSCYTDVGFTFAMLAALYMVVAAWPENRLLPYWLAGLIAGFCYAVKMPGLIAVVMIGGILGARRRWLPLAGFLSGSLLVLLPWVGRSFFATGNPFAPLLNGVFTNPWFSPDVDEYVKGVVRSYGGVRVRDIPLELAFRGNRLQGLIGPALFLIPVGVSALARKHSRPLAVAGIVSLAIYTQNIGARFILPAFLFLSFAAVAVMPKRVARVAGVLSAILCWPEIAARYADSGAFPSAKWPWKVALRMESQEEYLRREMEIYRFAEFSRNQFPPGSRVFDCVGLPSYYSGAVTLGHWQTRDLMRLHKALLSAAGDSTRRAKVAGQFRELGIPYITIPTWAGTRIEWVDQFIHSPEQWGFRLIGGVSHNQLYELLEPTGTTRMETVRATE